MIEPPVLVATRVPVASMLPSSSPPALSPRLMLRPTALTAPPKSLPLLARVMSRRWVCPPTTWLADSVVAPPATTAVLCAWVMLPPVAVATSGPVTDTLPSCRSPVASTTAALAHEAPWLAVKDTAPAKLLPAFDRSATWAVPWLASNCAAPCTVTGPLWLTPPAAPVPVVVLLRFPPTASVPSVARLALKLRSLPLPVTLPPTVRLPPAVSCVLPVVFSATARAFTSRTLVAAPATVTRPVKSLPALSSVTA